MVLLDTLFLKPFHADVDIVYYLHGAVTSLKPRLMFVFKPHRFFLISYCGAGIGISRVTEEKDLHLCQ